MIPGWIEVTVYGVDPNWKQGDPWHKRSIRVPNGEQECPDCRYRTDVNDPVGMHRCPELIDSDGNRYTVGDDMYFYASGRIKRGTVTRYKKETEKMTIQEWNDARNKHVLNNTRKALRINDNQE